jgi:hypothetical protein
MGWKTRAATKNESVLRVGCTVDPGPMRGKASKINSRVYICTLVQATAAGQCMDSVTNTHPDGLLPNPDEPIFRLITYSWVNNSPYVRGTC